MSLEVDLLSPFLSRGKRLLTSIGCLPSVTDLEATHMAENKKEAEKAGLTANSDRFALCSVPDLLEAVTARGDTAAKVAILASAPQKEGQLEQCKCRP